METTKRFMISRRNINRVRESERKIIVYHLIFRYIILLSSLKFEKCKNSHQLIVNYYLLFHDHDTFKFNLVYKFKTIIVFRETDY